MKLDILEEIAPVIFGWQIEKYENNIKFTIIFKFIKNYFYIRNLCGFFLKIWFLYLSNFLLLTK